MKFKWISYLILSVLLLILVFQNTQGIKLNLYFWHISVSGSLLYIILLFVGGFIGFSIHYILVARKNKNNQ